MTLVPLPSILIEPLVRAALLEDLGRAGDITTDAIVPHGQQATMVMRARAAGIVAGLDLAGLAFRLLDPTITIDIQRPDAAAIEPGETIATVRGAASAMLTAERTALNFLSHLSGIASATAVLVAATGEHKAAITCTRKTTPGLRTIEKYAVLAGGGRNHRFGLDDGLLIKDNHIALAGGIRPAIERARARIGHFIKIEVEVDTLAQLVELLSIGADAVLLDNMTSEMLHEAVTMIEGRMVSEASGNITAATVPLIAASGVDLISSGWLTHSAPALDIGFDFQF